MTKFSSMDHDPIELQSIPEGIFGGLYISMQQFLSCANAKMAFDLV